MDCTSYISCDWLFFMRLSSNRALVVVGLYLSRYSDLLQMNPFEVGSFGDMIIFKVMRVRFPLTLHELGRR